MGLKSLGLVFCKVIVDTLSPSFFEAALTQAVATCSCGSKGSEESYTHRGREGLDDSGDIHALYSIGGHSQCGQ